MTLVLDLPKEIEVELAESAARLGLPIQEYALRLLSASFASVPRPQNGAELLAYWQAAGVVGTRGEIHNSLEHANQLRKSAEHRGFN